MYHTVQMDLQCYEKIPDEKTLCCLSNKNKFQTLYKLARNKLFDKEHFCIYCGMIDFDKDWMKIHIKNNHDECGKVFPIFRCKICKRTIMRDEIMKHHIQHHI